MKTNYKVIRLAAWWRSLRGKITAVTVFLIVAGAVGVPPPTMATVTYSVNSTTYNDLAALQTAVTTLATGTLAFTTNFTDNSLTTAFGASANATLTLSGTNTTISRASGTTNDTVRFIDTANAFSLVAANGSTITFDGFGSLTNSQDGGVLYGDNITLGALLSTGILVFSNNKVGNSIDGGGAIYAVNDVTIIGGTNTFTGNRAELNRGGAIYAGALDSGVGDVTISGGTNTFTDNTTANGRGGAIAAENDLTLSGGINTFTNNISETSKGGALGTVSGDVILSGGINSFTGNETLDDRGGAIFAGDNAIISGGTNDFTSNSATGGRGGAISTTHNLTISSGTNSFTNNSTDISGGAIDTEALTLTGGINIFTGNSAADKGGAIFAASATLSGGTNTFTNNTATAEGGAIYALEDATLRATDGNFLFKGNIDNKGTALEKANAMYVGNGSSNPLTLAAASGRKIEFFDPITSDSTNPTLIIAINPLATDIGSVIFDGSYWQASPQNKTVAANPEYFTTQLYGDATLDYGKLQITNGAIFDVSGTIGVNGGTLEVVGDSKLPVNGAMTVANGATLTSGIYNDALNVWTSNVTTTTGTITFVSGSTWYVKESTAFPGGVLAGKIYVANDNLAQAALDLGNTQNTLYEFLYDGNIDQLYTKAKPKGDVNDTTVNVPIMFQAWAMSAAVGSRALQQFGFANAIGGIYRGQECEPCDRAIGHIGRISPMRPISYWANYIGRSTELVANSNIVGLAGTAKIVSNGVQFGADRMISKRTIVGAMFNYEHARDTLNASRTLGDNYAFAVYGAHQFAGGFDGIALVGYGHQKYDSRRYDVGALAFRNANYSGNTFEMTFETGRRIRLDKNLWMRPAVALDVYNNDIASFTEAGGLTFGKMSLTQAFARVGSDFIVKQNRLTMNSGFYYSYQMSEFGDRIRTTAAIGTAAPVNIWGSDLGRNKLTMNVGGSYALGAKNATSIFAGYSGDYFADRAGTPWGHNGYAGMRYQF